MLSINLNIPEEGYLNIISLSEGEKDGYLLYPNRWVADNHVTRGRLQIPGPMQANNPRYRIRQALPDGMSRQHVSVYAILTKEPLNFGKGIEDAAFKLIPDGKGPKLEEDASSSGGSGLGASRREYIIER